MSKIRREGYRALSILGDVEAAERGPAPLAKRLIRKRVYRHVGRGTRSVLRSFGLSR